MEHLPVWLAAAIDAAGVSTVYNAEDWDRLAAPRTPLTPVPPTLN